MRFSFRLTLLGICTCIGVVVVFMIWKPPAAPYIPPEVLPDPMMFTTTTVDTSTEPTSVISPLLCTNDRTNASILTPQGQGQLLHIAHTLGLTPEGVAGTNTKEAFIHSYEQGFRLFEADFLWTADEHILVAHDKHEPFWGITTPFSSTTYDMTIGARYMDVYTPLDIRSFLELLQEYPDTYVILDIKFDTAEQYDVLLTGIITEAIPMLGEEATYRRLIPQIYTPEDIIRTSTICLFTDILFTQYRNSLAWGDVLTFLRSYPGITGVATPYPQRFQDVYKTDLDLLGRGLYVHPVHEATVQQELITAGIGVFTTVSTTLIH